MASIRKHKALLEILANRKLNRKIRDSILRHGPDSLIVCLCSCCHNLVRGNLPLGGLHLKRLKCHRKWIHNIADTNCSAAKKRKFLLGGKSSNQALEIALPLILELVLSHFAQLENV